MKKQLFSLIFTLALVLSFAQLSFADGAIPIMTSNTDQSGIVTASSSYSVTPTWKAFDGKKYYLDGTYGSWGTTSPTGWLAYEFSTPKVINKYIIYSGTYGSTYDNGSQAKSWSFEGTNDNINWTVLDTRTDQPKWMVNISREFNFQNTTAYKKYRINVSANFGATTINKLTIHELEMYGYEIPADIIPPTATVSYSTTAPTNGDVIATITPSESVTITNNNGSASYQFTENGSFTFEFIDAAGNKGTATATVSNIDKILPIATVSYSTTAPTNGDVIATITPSESVTITNNNGSASYQFTENGSFTFEFIDTAGNKGTATATVSNIDKTPPTLVIKLEYAVIKSPNHKLVPIHAFLDYSDNVGISSVRLISIVSNEADNGLGDGDQSNDIADADYGTEDTSFSLRAERAGNGLGRIYTVTYLVVDTAGNSTTATAQVIVPHNSFKK